MYYNKYQLDYLCKAKKLESNLVCCYLKHSQRVRLTRDRLSIYYEQHHISYGTFSS